MQEKTLFLLENVLRNYKLDFEDVANIMFPTNKNADLALRRILRGEGHVSVDQLEALAMYIGASVPAVYDAGCNAWRDISDSEEELILKKGNYLVEYSFQTRALLISFENKAIYNKELQQEHITIDEFINLINSIINGSHSN